MKTANITFFGRRYPVSPRTAKFFIFGYLPLLMVFAFFNTYLQIRAVSEYFALSFWLALFGVVLCTFELKLSQKGEKETSLALLPWEPVRRVFGIALLGFSLLHFANTDEPIFVASLAAYALFRLVSYFGKLTNKLAKDATP
jgi:hypothetical protein